MEDAVARTNFEKLEVYQLSEKLADQIWEIIVGWQIFAKGYGRETDGAIRG